MRLQTLADEKQRTHAEQRGCLDERFQAHTATAATSGDSGDSATPESRQLSACQLSAC